MPGAKGVVELDARPLEPDNRRYWLTPTSDHELAYIDQGNVWSLDVFTGKTRQLSHLTGETLEWLDFNPNTGEFLFNLTDAKHNAALYHFNPGVTNGPAAMTARGSKKGDTSMTPIIRILKGQWLLGGDGVAYVKESLFVETGNKAYSTNLFANGYVQSYSVAPGQEKLYALASFDPDPLGIWEYDVVGRKLRNVVPALEKGFAVSQTIPIEEKQYGSPDGKKKISYRYLPPANLDEHKKYPALVCVPHGSHWTAEAQMVANAGIFYVFVPTKSTVPETGGLTPAAAEMLTAYYALLENPNVDPHRIYILDESHQTADLKSLLAHDPSLWRGVIIAAPIMLPDIPADTTRFPSILISIGTDDNGFAIKMVEDLTRKSFQSQIRLRVNYLVHGAHVLAGTDLNKERYESIIKFILRGY